MPQNNKSSGEQKKAQSSISRTIPSDLGAEAAVLGSMIVDPGCIGDVLEKVDRNSFYHPEHARIFDVIVSLWEKSAGGVDGLLVRKELESRGWLASIGGVEYLSKVMETVPSSANAIYYAEIVQEKALARALIMAANDTMNDAYEPGDIRQTIDKAEQRIFQVSERRVTEQSVQMKSLVVDAYSAIEKRQGSQVTGIPTGFYELDEMCCGLQKGELTLLAARPSAGKTALALNIAEHIGMIDNLPVAIFSLEMGRQQLAERFLSSRSGVDSLLMRKGMIDGEAFQVLLEACSALSEAPIYVDDTSAMTPLELRAKARRMAHKEGVQCVIVDYLQLMTVGGKVESRQQEITTISRQLKGLARELNVPIIALSQLNRALESREDHRPRMSDLRESGSLEQDADVVLMLHREDYYHKNDPEYVPDNIAEVIITKQRNGPTGVVKLTFRDKCTRFENLAQASNEVPW